MSMEAKPPVSTPATPTKVQHREKGIRIFMWPKVIYIFPSAIVALICSIGMWRLSEKSYDPSKPVTVVTSPTEEGGPTATTLPAKVTQLDRFRTPQNLLAMLFLAMLAFNLLVMALDLPRFSLVARDLAILFALVLHALAGLVLPSRPDEADPQDLRVDLRRGQHGFLLHGLS